MEEEWRMVSGFEGMYEVSNHGNVRSLLCGRVKTLSKASSKIYEVVCLVKERRKYTKPIHRMVAEAFHPFVEGKDTVDHIDRNPKNNHVSNLRWADRTEQSVNRECYSNSHHKNISQSVISGQYHVVIRRYGITYMNSAFNTLEEAILARDGCLFGLESVL